VRRLQVRVSLVLGVALAITLQRERLVLAHRALRMLPLEGAPLRTTASKLTMDIPI
jgi:hypothetical protein